jgi:hypothetical protein
VLHQVWGFQGTGNSWTKVLMQMPLVMKWINGFNRK